MLHPDLHIHTTASDGVLSPSQVVLRAMERGVDFLAVSDHDTLNGLSEAEHAAQAAGVHFLPALEISAGGDKEIHILGYGVSAQDAALTAYLDAMKEDRRQRSIKMLDRLRTLGMPLSPEDLAAKPGASIGRPLIARAMIAKGYVRDMNEAFSLYLGRGCPAYVARTDIDVCEVISLLRRAHAVPVLAHPGLLGWDEETFSQQLHRWLDAGLMGMEIYHPAHEPDQFEKWRSIATRHQLILTGGSDFHEPDDKHADIGQMIPYWKTANEDMQQLLSAVNAAKGN